MRIKALADSKALIPVLKDFFQETSSDQPQNISGGCSVSTPLKFINTCFWKLPLRKLISRLTAGSPSQKADCPLNEDGIPCCPKNPSLPMKQEGSKSHLRCGLPTVKFVCPKMKWIYIRKLLKRSRRVCHCENPCTESSCGRMVYLYPEKNLRAYPGTAPRYGGMGFHLQNQGKC